MGMETCGVLPCSFKVRHWSIPPRVFTKFANLTFLNFFFPLPFNERERRNRSKLKFSKSNCQISSRRPTFLSNILFSAFRNLLLIARKKRVRTRWKLKFNFLFQFFISFGNLQLNGVGTRERKKQRKLLVATRSMNYRLEYRNISSTISLNKQHPLLPFSRVLWVGSPARHLGKIQRTPEESADEYNRAKEDGKWQSNETDIKLIYTRFCIFLVHPFWDSGRKQSGENIFKWISDARKADIDNVFVKR